MEKSYCWCITKDYVDEDLVGVVGPHDSPLEANQIKNHKESKHFKVYDDDMVLYFEGYMLHDDESDGFEPLYDFGTSLGAVHIKYRNPKTNKYEIL